MARVQLVEVTKRFGSTVAVDRVSLDIADGEFLVLVGPSGCGKSTLLRLIAGLEDVTEGAVYIGDRNVNDVPPKDRDVAMVFQNYALYPHMTVYDNMAFGLRMRKVPRDEIDRRVREAAETLGLTNLLKRRPAQLSGGQRQRVALGRAIVRDPKVFLMDEPLSNLDAQLRVQMRTELARLHQRLGTTTIYVTHDQVEAMTLGDRIAVMRDGKLQQVATPREIYARPANVFVASFIGSPPMNFVRGVVERGDGEVRFAGAGLTCRLEGELAEAAAAYLAGGGAGSAAGSREVLLGVRPEHIHARPADAADGAGAHMVATVEVVEPLGAETFVYVAAGSVALTVRVDPRLAVRPGDRLALTLDAEHLHLFDAATEQSLRELAAAVPA
ncbi:carbohydrate ABC transporter ATP-binding protein, CUT1 family [Thermaerobacter marianensis DSM 12885]|uniref:Carbohydrate ABC transporter ATP-binding protein, CUT1 family n=1 Tax=Thermaerobacter marianensis (strain ATCC 700841 / DSM 12885 / JCM 10246 / 7p75a) TaxID=644966 RepID=E6SJ69_THEM7|nr:ABC transporter ATP-binding protein [Thermaerobacter marianensis]ADU52093.1 carbohydrate ABC transporter ATP-binding protein, CUT1 family [Thermaerobacter marianensis DSM 12885]